MYEKLSAYVKVRNFKIKNILFGVAFLLILVPSTLLLASCGCTLPTKPETPIEIPEKEDPNPEIEEPEVFYWEKAEIAEVNENGVFKNGLIPMIANDGEKDYIIINGYTGELTEYYVAYSYNLTAEQINAGKKLYVNFYNKHYAEKEMEYSEDTSENQTLTVEKIYRLSNLSKKVQFAEGVKSVGIGFLEKIKGFVYADEFDELLPIFPAFAALNQESSEDIFLCSLEELVLPDSFLSFGYLSLTGVPLQNLNLSKNFDFGKKEISELVEQGYIISNKTQEEIDQGFLPSIIYSEINNINVDPSNTMLSSLDGVLFNKDKSELILYPNRKDSEYVIPETVEIIKNSAFSWNMIRSVTISKNVVIIEDNAFHETPNLTNVMFTEGAILEKIESGAFFKSAITNITIPDSVISIGQEAFSRSELESIEFTKNSQLETIGDSAFFKSKITNITIPDSVISIGQEAFSDSKLSNIVFTEDSQLTTIGKLAFSRNDLTTIIIPEGVVNIGEEAFRENQFLSNITVLAVTPPSLSSFGEIRNIENIFVPDESVDAYKIAWVEYTEIIKGIPASD